MQLAFSSEDGAVFECALAFEDTHFANINFFDRQRKDILFHVSFRFRRQTIVHNTRIDGKWGEEWLNPVTLDPTGNRLQLRFNGGRASVVLNGETIMTTAIANADAIEGAALHWYAFDGGVADIKIDGPAHANRRGRGMLALDAPFLLQGWGFDPAANTQDLSIGIDGTDKALTAIVHAMPEIAREQRSATPDIGVFAQVPGWIWKYSAADGDEQRIRLQLRSNERPCGPVLEITKDRIVETIEEIAQKGDAVDTFEVLCAMEHVRFGDLAGQLSLATRDLLRKKARELGVTEFLEATPLFEAESGTEAPVAREPNPHAERLKAAAGQLCDADYTDYPQVLAGFDFGPFTQDQRIGFLLSLVPAFIEANQIEALHARAVAEGLMEVMPAAEANWTLGPSLPLHYLSGNSEAVVGSFRRLRDIGDAWVGTSGVSWALQHLVVDAPDFVLESDRESAVDSFLHFIGSIGTNYYGQAPCHWLIDAMVCLLGHSNTFPDDMQGWIRDRALSCYGLSPTFWAKFQALRLEHPVPMGAALTAAETAFATILECIEEEDWTGATAAILPHGMDRQRFLRELLATRLRNEGSDPSILSPLVGPGLADADDPILRFLAHPGCTTESPDLAGQARRAIRRQSPMVDRSPYADLQQTTGAIVHNLLEGPTLTEETATSGVANLLPNLRTLCSARSDHIGWGMAISLVTAATEKRDEALAQEMVGFLRAQLQRVPHWDVKWMNRAWPTRTALQGLAQAQSERPHPLQDEVLRLFSDAQEFIEAPWNTPKPCHGTGLSSGPIARYYDTIVVVFSCVPNLETRIPAMRESWLNRLKEKGIPYIVVVGNGDGRREGDIVHLDAPDSYEGLPFKTLAAVEWVHSQTPFGHMLKIDDDCFLDVERFFEGQFYRKYPYYGRPLERNAGQTDRIWHHSRGSGATAAMEIDKSPEPSLYADGGSGYVLNRNTMRHLLANARTRAGAQLKLVSFMEDKLVGDLLAMSDIRVRGTDYFTCILRRNHSKGRSVGRWVNGFLPSKATPTQMAHLDNTYLQEVAAEKVTGNGLSPSRVWPTYAPVKVGLNDSHVELISSAEKLEEVNSHDVCVVGCVRNELQMLPMFLDHYRKLGVKGFLISDNCSDDGTLEYLYDQPDVCVFSGEAAYGVTEYGVAWQQAILANLRLNRWSLVVDADEFLMLPEGQSDLTELTQQPDIAMSDAVRIYMLDMYPEGSLSDATLDSGDPFAELTHVDREPFTDGFTRGAFGNLPTWTSSLRHRLLPESRRELFVAQKYALVRYKPWMRFSAGLHYITEAQIAEQELIFAHFKYHAAFRARALEETRRGQHFNNAEEYRRYLALMSEGRDVLFDPDVSVHWKDCDFVQSVLGKVSGDTEKAIETAVHEPETLEETAENADDLIEDKIPAEEDAD